MELELRDHVAVICGGSKGIGKACASSLAREGARTVLLSRTEETLLAAAAEIEAAGGTRPHVIVGDVADPLLASRVVAETMERFGRLDIMINNAGGPPMGSFFEHDLDTWHAAVQTNLLSVVTFTRAAAEVMKAAGYGRIINITTVLAKEPTPAMVLSGTLRAGVSAFSKAISTELIKSGVCINTVCPAAVLTERAESLTRVAAERDGISYEEALARAQKGLPIGRLAAPIELGDVVAFLCSPKAGYISGVSLMVDGGVTRAVF